jgi:hypothetical protein
MHRYGPITLHVRSYCRGAWYPEAGLPPPSPSQCRPSSPHDEYSDPGTIRHVRTPTRISLPPEVYHYRQRIHYVGAFHRTIGHHVICTSWIVPCRIWMSGRWCCHHASNFRPWGIRFEVHMYHVVGMSLVARIVHIQSCYASVTDGGGNRWVSMDRVISLGTNVCISILTPDVQLVSRGLESMMACPTFTTSTSSRPHPLRLDSHLPPSAVCSFILCPSIKPTGRASLIRSVVLSHCVVGRCLFVIRLSHYCNI